MRLLVPALLAAAIAAPAIAAGQHSFTRDGETYRYTAQARANGTVRVTGVDETTAAPFDLFVRDGHVRGTMNSTPVSFEVSRETMARLASEVAPAAAETAAIGD